MQITVGTKQLDAINKRLVDIMGANPPVITASKLAAASCLDGITVQELESLFELALHEAFKAGEDFTHQQYEEDDED